MRIEFLVLLVPVGALAQVEYRGQLDRELTPPPSSHQVSDFKLATAEQRRLLEDRVHPSDLVFAGSVRGAMAFVVECDRAETVLFVDLNGDGRIAEDERHALGPATDPLHAGIVTVLMPLSGTVYRHYPVRVYVYKPQKKESRIVGESPRCFVRGTVAINGRPTLVEYEFDRSKNSASPDYGWQGIDTNGDGKIDTTPQSPEYAFARDEQLVFRVGDQFVSTRTLDLDRGEVLLRSQGKADYQRIELKPGITFPDFVFVDFGGSAHKLSEYSPRYVLLDFWATWCGPCVNDLPHFREVYEQIRDMGLVVIGMNVDEDSARARKMFEEKRIPWVQASFDSIRDLVERRVRVAAYPTYVLLDPQRKIIESDSEALRGERLLSTLRKHLAAAPPR